MQFLSAVLSALVVTAGYLVSLKVMNKRYDLALPQDRTWIKNRAVSFSGLLVCVTTGIIAYVRLYTFSLPVYCLMLVLLCGMSVLAFVDKKKKIVPNKVLLLLLCVWIAIVSIYVIADTGNGLALVFQAGAGSIIGGLIFLVCYLLSGKQLGAGDVKLVFVMGLYLTGQRIIGAIFYGTICCCVFSMIQMARKKIGLKDGVPMVPFLYIGVLITLFIM